MPHRHRLRGGTALEAFLDVDGHAQLTEFRQHARHRLVERDRPVLDEQEPRYPRDVLRHRVDAADAVLVEALAVSKAVVPEAG
jgi:hypothetical protein